MKEFFTEREWEIILDAVEQEGIIADEEYSDECSIIIDKIHSMIENNV